MNDDLHTRHDGRDTSRAAGRSLGPLRPKQAAVLNVLRTKGAQTDEMLVWLYKHGTDLELPPQSDSGIRSRRAELVLAGLVVSAGKGRTTTGRACHIWKAVERP